MIEKILNELIEEAKQNPEWTAEQALRCAKKELLKAIHPSARLMSNREIRAWAETPEAVRKPIYYESKAGVSHWVVNPSNPNSYYLATFDGDGRCWTSKPTDEQKKEEKWDD